MKSSGTRPCIRITVSAIALVITIVGLSCSYALIVVADTGNRQPQFVYKTVGERKLTLDMDYPPKWKCTDKRPAIVFFFGGGWTNGSPQQFRPQAEYFAQRGLVCCRADYRLRARDGVWPDKCVEDARSAMRWVRKHAAELGVDPDRIVAAGGSAGGHLAACTFFAAGIDSPDDEKSVSPQPNAMVLYNPALDLTHLPPKIADKLVRGLNDETLKEISPLLHLGKGIPPTLLLDGTQDWLNPQVREFVRKGKSLGAPVEAYYADGQPHGFFNRAPWLENTTAEVDHFLSRIGYLSKEPKVPLPTIGGRQSHAKSRPVSLGN